MSSILFGATNQLNLLVLFLTRRALEQQTRGHTIQQQFGITRISGQRAIQA
jgi:hypothetical protein